jgi:hypothetical protein
VIKRFAWLALAVLALLPYLGAIHHPLLYDDRTLLDNRWLTTEAGPVSVFQHDYWHGTKHERSDLYRPLTVLSLAWNMRYAGSREGVRIVNALLHVLATLALLEIFRRLCRDLGGDGPWPFFGAALFAVHPLASEAVLCAVGRAEILAALFGMFAFGRFLSLENGTRRRAAVIAASAACFFLALCSKESAVSWVAIAAAYLAVTSAWKRYERRDLLWTAAGWLVSLAAFLVLRGQAVGWTVHPPPFVDNPLVAADAVTRGANAVLLFARYLAKALWPASLSIEYGFDQITVLPLLPWAGVCAVAIAAAIVAGIVVLVRRGSFAAAFLIAWVPAAFAVTGNFLFPIGTIFAERLAYLPLMGMCGLAGIGLASIPRRRWGIAALGVLLAAGAGRTIARGRDCADLATLSEATASSSPRAVKALVNAGRTRLRQGRAAEAIPLFERAIAIWPDYTRARELLEQARSGASAPPSRDD